jgi:hypothetical protein
MIQVNFNLAGLQSVAILAEGDSQQDRATSQDIEIEAWRAIRGHVYRIDAVLRAIRDGVESRIGNIHRT